MSKDAPTSRSVFYTSHSESDTGTAPRLPILTPRVPLLTPQHAVSVLPKTQQSTSNVDHKPPIPLKPIKWPTEESEKEDSTGDANAASRCVLRRSVALGNQRANQDNYKSHRSAIIRSHDDDVIIHHSNSLSSDSSVTSSWRSSSTSSRRSNVSNASHSTEDDVLHKKLSACSSMTSGSTDSDACHSEFDDDFEWPSDEFDEFDDEGDYPTDAVPPVVLSPADKRKNVATEMMTTETSYVARLYTVFKTSLILEGANRMKHFLADNFRAQMFPCIETLYMLHNENILPALRARMAEWSSKPYMYDIWREYLPYLTTYKLYAQQFNAATQLIQKARDASSDFASLLTDLEREEGFKKLNLESLLLEPIQRLPRYRLMLESYLKYLSTDEQEERSDIEDMVKAVGKLAQDCETTLKEKDMFGDFQKIQDRIEDMLSVLNPQAKLLKEGPCTEITASSHKKHIQRYLFLFSDFLLVCSSRLLSNKLAIRKHLEVDELRLRPCSNLYTLNYDSDTTMNIKCKECVIDVMFTDEATKWSWEDMLLYAICNKVKTRLEKFDPDDKLIVRGNSADFKRAPIWIHDEKTDTCMMCRTKFQAVVKRRHHCRGCGIVVCSKCCNQRISLPYKDKEMGRVCNNCFLRARRDCIELTRRISTKRPSNRHKQPNRTDISADNVLGDVSGKSEIYDVSGKSEIDDVTGKSEIDDVTGKSEIDDVTGKSEIDDVSGKSDIDIVQSAKAHSVVQKQDSDKSDTGVTLNVHHSYSENVC